MKCSFCGAALPEKGYDFLPYLMKKSGSLPVCLQCARQQMRLDRSASLKLEKLVVADD